MQGYKFFRYTVVLEQQAALEEALRPYMSEFGPGWILTPSTSASTVAAILAQYSASVVAVIPKVSL